MPPVTRSTLCEKCGEKVTQDQDLITCAGKCGGIYHVKCMGITKEAYSDVKNGIKKVICDTCHQQVNITSENNQTSKGDSMVRPTLETLRSLDRDDKINGILQNQWTIEKRISDKMNEISQKLTEAFEMIKQKDDRISFLEQEIKKLQLTEKSSSHPTSNNLPQKIVPAGSKSGKPAQKIDDKSSNSSELGNGSNSNVVPNTATEKQRVKRRNTSESGIRSDINAVPDRLIEKEPAGPSRLYSNIVAGAGNNNPIERNHPLMNKQNKHEDDFKIVTYKKAPRINKIIRGSGETSEDLTCIESKIWIFLGRCSKSVTLEKVNGFLKNRYPEYEFDVSDIESKGIYNSYRIGANVDLKEALYNSANWPKGSLIKRYLFRRSGANFPAK